MRRHMWSSANRSRPTLLIQLPLPPVAVGMKFKSLIKGQTTRVLPGQRWDGQVQNMQGLQWDSPKNGKVWHQDQYLAERVQGWHFYTVTDAGEWNGRMGCRCSSLAGEMWQAPLWKLASNQIHQTIKSNVFTSQNPKCCLLQRVLESVQLCCVGAIYMTKGCARFSILPFYLFCLYLWIFPLYSVLLLI